MAKFGIKKIVLALAGLGLTGAAFASITPDSAFSNPTPTGYGWHITAMGDWLQPNTNDLEFASVNTSTSSSITNGFNSGFGSYGVGVQPQYDFGYGFEIGMQIPGTTDDVTVNWQQLDTHNSDNVRNVGPNQVVVLPDLSTVQNASAKATLDYDAVNLEFGHTIFDNQWTVRPFAGVQYARIKGSIDTIGTAQYSFAGATTNVVDSVTENGDFHGIGPRVGVDGKYNLGYGFGIVGEAAAELLVGTSSSSLNATNVSTVNDPTPPPSVRQTDDSSTYTSVESVNPEEERVVIPGLEAKAGLAYDQVINPSLCLGIEAGYYVADYIHAIPRSNSADYVYAGPSQSSSGPGFFANNRNTDFSMQGPYVALSLNF